MNIMSLVELHIHIGDVQQDKTIITTLNKILKTMATKDEILADNAKIGAALTNIAADIKSLNEQIKNSSSEEDWETVRASSAELASRAEALDALTPNAPVEPPVEPPTEPVVTP